MNESNSGRREPIGITAVYEDSTALHPLAGLEAVLTAGPLLHFGNGITIAEREQRTSAELASVLYAPDFARPDDVLYTVYRGIAPPELAPEIKRRGLIYVALVMRPGTVGEEWVRTRGHTNPDARATHIAYPEVHEVWNGQGLLYLQRETTAKISHTVVIPLKPGDKAIVAPGWACLMVNVGAEPLVIGSWRTVDCISQTHSLVAMGGMAHYVLRGETPGTWHFAPNPKYDAPPAPREITPQELPDFGLKHGEPMLTTFHANPDFLRFLLRPQDYGEVWSRIYGAAS
jgi:glucose-6-phosphate isomerase, archaeal